MGVRVASRQWFVLRILGRIAVVRSHMRRPAVVVIRITRVILKRFQHTSGIQRVQRILGRIAEAQSLMRQPVVGVILITRVIRMLCGHILGIRFSV